MREKIIAGNIYHVLNRGVDKRKIFLDDKDYFRFIHDLFEFNDENPANNSSYHYLKNKKQSIVIARRYIKRERKLLVKILAFCLMPNHYHLLLMPLSDDGISKFIKKLNMGYARYFNEKYDRKGTLFEGRYKLVPVTKEPHFIHLPYYLHLNPLDLIESKWREKEIKNYQKAIKFLENYRWSSHLSYTGKENFSSVTQRDFLLEIFGGHQKYEKNIRQWLKERRLQDQNTDNIFLE